MFQGWNRIILGTTSTEATSDVARGRDLHSAACGIACETAPVENKSALHHVSGSLFQRFQDATCISPAAAQLLDHLRLSSLGQRLEYSTQLLGQGGYARVFQGREVLSLSIPALLNRVVEIIAAHKSLLVFKGLVVDAKQLVKGPLGRHLNALSEPVLQHGWRVATYCGISVLLPSVVPEPRPCAVKVLTQDSCSKGAYGGRSAENEVLIALHVTSACAACPYVGKAHGFEYAQRIPGAPDVLACVDPDASGASPTAILLALEPYTVDVEAARAARSGERAGGRACVADEAAEGERKPAARQVSKQRQDASSAASRSMNLWEYLVWLRERDAELTVDEIKSLALQLVLALHSLHNDANVMHLDVKPSNMLLDHRLDLHLVDFGFSAAFEREKPFISVHRRGRGTPMYTAPEMLDSGPRLITPAADVFSFGCCLLTMCTAGCPHEPCAPTESSRRHVHVGHSQPVAGMARDSIPAKVPQQFRAVLARCLRRQPSLRPSTAELLTELSAISSEAPRPALVPCTCELGLSTPFDGSAFSEASSDSRRVTDLPDFCRLLPAASLVSPQAPPASSPQQCPPIREMLSHTLESTSSTCSNAGSLLSGSAARRRSSLAGGKGNTVLPDELRDSSVLQQLSVEGRSTQHMRYTKSLRTGLAGVMQLQEASQPRPAHSNTSSASCWSSECSRTFSSTANISVC